MSYSLPPVYVINCPEHTQRRQFVEFRLRQQNVQFELFPAVAANDVYVEFWRHKQRYIDAEFADPSIVNAAAYACLLSHRNLLRKLCAANISEALIFEDDVYLAYDFVERCAALLATPEADAFDVLYLGANAPRKTPEQEMAIIDGHPVIEVSYDTAFMTYGTYAMRLTRHAMLRVLEYIEQLPIGNYTPIDILLGRMHRGGNLRAGVANPQLVIPDVQTSTIREGRDLHEYLQERGLQSSPYQYADVSNLYYHVKNHQPHYFSTMDSIEWLRGLGADRNNFFVFIIPAYNAVDWCQRNLKSIAEQSYPYWRAVYIDDGSQDQTTYRAYEAAKSFGIENKISFWQLAQNHGPAYARFLAYTQCHPCEVCCMLDGDDWLQDPQTLQRLNQVYKDGYNMTYGSAVVYEHGELQPTAGFPRTDYAQEVHIQKSYRSEPWLAQHFRTMRAELLRDMPAEYLFGPDNTVIRCCTDMAESFYALDKSYCRPKHMAEPVYVYNKDNSTRYPLSYYRRHDVDADTLAYRAQIEQFVRTPPDKRKALLA